MKTLIKNATVVLPKETAKTNVLIEGTKIIDTDAPASVGAAEVIDATGLHLLPGIIDDQVHFRDPGVTYKEDLYTASRACAKGGVTSFLEMPNTVPKAVSQARMEEKLAIASQKSVVNYGFYIGATPYNVEELKHAHRVSGIKIFIGSSTGDLLVDGQEALERIFAETTLPICAHCEDETTVQANMAKYAGSSDITNHSRIRNHEAALIATKRAMDLAFRHNHRFHVLHVSTGGETELFDDMRGLVTAEVCPHHLYFNVDDYERLGSRVQMNPSIKNKEDNEKLWEAMIDGRIQVIATDHAPHTLEEKAQPYPKSPSGLPAVENYLALMLNEVNRGRFDLQLLVDRMCDAPARVWDMVDKGRIEVGYDADLVLVDMNKKQSVLDDNQLTKCGWSPWHGTELQGWAVRTICMGETVFMDGKVNESHRGHEIIYDHARGGYWATLD